MGANSFLLEQTTFQKGCKTILTVVSLEKYPFALRYHNINGKYCKPLSCIAHHISAALYWTSQSPKDLLLSSWWYSGIAFCCFSIKSYVVGTSVVLLLSTHITLLWSIKENDLRSIIKYASILLFLHKIYVVDTRLKHLTEGLLMNTYNICFYGELEKIIPEVLLNTHLITPLVSYSNMKDLTTLQSWTYCKQCITRGSR